jgi:hypothetical protein
VVEAIQDLKVWPKEIDRTPPEPIKPPYHVVYYGVSPFDQTKIMAYAVFGPDWHGYNQKPGFCGDVPPHENT